MIECMYCGAPLLFATCRVATIHHGLKSAACLDREACAVRIAERAAAR